MIRLLLSLLILASCTNKREADWMEQIPRLTGVKYKIANSPSIKP